MEAKDFIQEYVNRMAGYQETILEFLEEEDTDIQNLSDYFNSQNVHGNKEEVKGILHLISKTSENHYLLLQLFESKILIPDESIAQIIKSLKYRNRKYPHFFYPEFQSFFDDFLNRQIKSSCKEINQQDIEEFNKKRKVGENDEYICQLIREDNVDDFIVYVNKNNYRLNKKVTKSIYDTNTYLIKNNASLIEYSAFFGAIKIFRYLYMNNVDVDSNLWYYTIHGNNPELIHFLEENNIFPEDKKYEKCYKVAIKCHHIGIMNYIDNNFTQDEDLSLFSQCLKCYNFKVLTSLIDIGIQNLINFCNKKIQNDFHNVLYDFIKYDYYSCIAFIIETTPINLNYQVNKIYKISTFYIC